MVSRTRAFAVFCGCLGVLTAVALGNPSATAEGSSHVPHSVPVPHGVSVSLKWADLLGGGSAIVTSSPTLVNLSGGPSVVVGSRDNGCVYAVHLSNGTTPAGWGHQCTGYAIDSTPAAVPTSSGLDDVVVSEGDNLGLNANQGGIVEYGPAGNVNWQRTLPDVYGAYGPSPAVEASPAVGDTGTGEQRIVVGDIGLSLYSLDPGSGATIGGWPQKTADTTFATAAIAPIGPTQSIVAASDSAAGSGALDNWDGGAVRKMVAAGGTAWTNASNEVVSSSPAVGNLDGAGPVAVFGHGDYWGGSDQDGLTAVNAETGATEWEAHLGGYTHGSPALADLTGSGQLDIVESTWRSIGSPTGGTVYAFAPNGARLWGPVTPPPGPAGAGNPNTITGGVATADFGQGYQDVVVATGIGWDILDGRSGSLEASEGIDMPGGSFAGDPNQANLSMENTPLVAPDPSGHGLDVVVAGTYWGLNGDTTQGFIADYQVSSAPNNVGVQAWPEFHHDPQLTGSADPPLPPPGTCIPNVPPCSTEGYDLVASDGGIFSYGAAGFHGSMGGQPLNQPVVGIASDEATGGYWEVASDGGIFSFDAPFHGSMGGHPLNKPVVGIAEDTATGGYWEVASDGGIFSFDAPFHGSMGGHPLNQPIVGIAYDPATGGYWEVASDGGIFSFDAPFYGSMGGKPLNKPIVGIAYDPATGGYWEVASDGGIFAFHAPFYGSMGGQPINEPVVGISQANNGSGYWEVAADGGIFSFRAYFRGSAGGLVLNQPVVGMAGTG